MRPAKSRFFTPEVVPRRQTGAFTLVEVALALGIFAFAIVAILGLISVSMNSSRDSTTDTVLSEMTQSTLTYLRSNSAPISAAVNPAPTPSQRQGFTAIKTLVGVSAVYGPNSTIGTFYFDMNGQMERDVYGRPYTPGSGVAISAPPPSPNVYSCTVQARLPTQNPGNATVVTSLIYLQLQFRWPVAAQPANQQMRIVNASIANYD